MGKPKINKIITAEQAIEALRRIVKDKGEDFRYQEVEDEYGDAACQYVGPDGGASCAVGIVMIDFYHIPTSVIIPNEGDSASMILNKLKDNGVLKDVEEEAVQILAAFQSLQDQRVPYGICLKYTEMSREVGFGSSMSNTEYQRIREESGLGEWQRKNRDYPI